MRRLSVLVVLAVLATVLAVTSNVAFAADPNSGCTTIQDGTLLRGDGELIVLGFDEWGYNYQGHLFSGGYCDAYRDATWCWPYREIELIMKWNDAWLSNRDCDDDGLLDRHYGFDSYIGSGAWETNHQSGTYEEDGVTCKWNYFVKIVAVPADAVSAGGVWYTADGVEIGPVIWGEFAVIQEVYNDTCTGEHGLAYKSPVSVGFGFYMPDGASKSVDFSIEPTSWGQIKSLFR